MNKKDFADFVKKKRKDIGLTQEELAEQLNVSRDVVSKWESGKRYPDMETSQKLAYIFGVTPTEMYEQSSVNDDNPLIRPSYVIAPIVGLLLLIGLVLIPLATRNNDVKPATDFTKTEPQYYMDMKSAASEDRYYYINNDALVYYEKENSNIKYLCKKENCGHMDVSCDAHEIVSNIAPKAIWYYNDRLYMIERGTESKIISYNLDGEDRKTHSNLKVEGSDVVIPNSAYAMCFNEGYVYYFTSNASKVQLYRVSIETGSSPELITSYDQSKFAYGSEVTLTAMPKKVYVNISLGSLNTQKYTYILDYYDLATNQFVKVWETDSEKNSGIVGWGRNSYEKSFVFDNVGNMYYATAKDNEYVINKLNINTKQQEKFYSIKCNTFKPENSNSTAVLSTASDADYIDLQLFDGKYLYITRGVNLKVKKEDFIEATIKYGSDNSKTLVTKPSTNYIFVIDGGGNCVDIKELQAEGIRESNLNQSGNMPINLFVGNAGKFIMNVDTDNIKNKGIYEGNVVDGNISVSKIGK